MIYTDIDTAPSQPGSPPGMTASKSSKSSSFRSLHSDDGSIVADVSHFEDIGLDGDEPIYATAQALELKPAPIPRARELAARPRLAIPKTRPPLSLQTDHRPKNLPVAVSSGRRSPSPNPHLVGNLRPRRASWQSIRERKSVLDLERECDEDSGDDIPDDLILDNVPISPRPPQERSASSPLPSPIPSPLPGRISPRTSSPPTSRNAKASKKEKGKPAGAGTPAVPSAENSGSLRTPTWKSDTHLPTVKSLPPSPIKVRAKSWNIALSELSAEAKALTEKLEVYADEQLRSHAEGAVNPYGSPRSNRHSLDSHSPKSSTARRGSGNKDPFKKQLLLNQTNILLDPLPMSKEKEAVLSRTRPSWLPPKNPAEERKHMKEYQKMMAYSLEMEKKREAAQKNRAATREAAADTRKQIWERDVLPRWDVAVRERRTRELWWKGVAPRVRGQVWSRAIGNDLGLTDKSFQAALKRSQELVARVEKGNGTSEDTRRAEQVKRIRKDVQATYADLKIFSVGGPLHQGLIDVLSAYAMYRSDIGYVHGCNTIAALLLLNLATPADSFIALANILNRPLPLSFYARDPGAKSSAYNLLLQTLHAKSPSLSKHLGGLAEDPDVYLGPLFTSIFTGHLALDEANRLWDVYVFEGDSVLVRAGVAILLMKEMDLLAAGDIEEVRKILEGGKSKRARMLSQDQEEEKWVTMLREAGKA